MTWGVSVAEAEALRLEVGVRRTEGVLIAGGNVQLNKIQSRVLDLLAREKSKWPQFIEHAYQSLVIPHLPSFFALPRPLLPCPLWEEVDSFDDCSEMESDWSSRALPLGEVDTVRLGDSSNKSCDSTTDVLVLLLEVCFLPPRPLLDASSLGIGCSSSLAASSGRGNNYQNGDCPNNMPESAHRPPHPHKPHPDWSLERWWSLHEYEKWTYLASCSKPGFVRVVDPLHYPHEPHWGHTLYSRHCPLKIGSFSTTRSTQTSLTFCFVLCCLHPTTVVLCLFLVTLLVGYEIMTGEVGEGELHAISQLIVDVGLEGHLRVGGSDTTTTCTYNTILCC